MHAQEQHLKSPQVSFQGNLCYSTYRNSYLYLGYKMNTANMSKRPFSRWILIFHKEDEKTNNYRAEFQY